MQNQVMDRLGILIEEQVSEKYAGKIERVRPRYDREQDFVTVSKELQSRHRYSDMYWGGASFFLHLNDSLKKMYHTTLAELIQQYQACCRLEDDSLEDVIASWDQILGGSACSDLLKYYKTEPASNIFEAL